MTEENITREVLYYRITKSKSFHKFIYKRVIGGRVPKYFGLRNAFVGSEAYSSMWNLYDYFTMKGLRCYMIPYRDSIEGFDADNIKKSDVIFLICLSFESSNSNVKLEPIDFLETKKKQNAGEERNLNSNTQDNYIDIRDKSVFVVSQNSKIINNQHMGIPYWGKMNII